MSDRPPADDPGGDAHGRRRAARLVLLDESQTSVLLVLGFDPAHPGAPYWFTVGGGVEPGETPLEAVVREAWEEIGYALDPSSVLGPFAPEDIEFSFDGEVIRQHQAYYVAVVPAADHHRVSRFHGADDVERGSVVRVAWVPLVEVPELAEPVFPSHLTDIVTGSRASVGGQPRRR